MIRKIIRIYSLYYQVFNDATILFTLIQSFRLENLNLQQSKVVSISPVDSMLVSEATIFR